MDGGVGLALVVGLVIVVVVYAVIDFMKAMLHKLSRSRSPFTEEETRAYYRGLHRGRLESGAYNYHHEDAPKRWLIGKRIREVQRIDESGQRFLQREIEWEEPTDDSRYIEAERAPPHAAPRSQKLLK